MRKTGSYLLLIYVFLVFACQDNKSTTSDESQNEQSEEITLLTTDSRLKNSLESVDIDSPKLKNPEAVAKYYEKNDHQPIWRSEKLRNELFSYIQNIEFEGLFFEDYHGEYLKKILPTLSENSNSENTILELVLTDSFLQLAKDLGTGKLNPTEIYSIWGTPLNEVKAVELLERAILKEDISSVLDSVKPHHIVYNGLKKSLAEFKRSGIEDDSITKIPTGKLVRPGETEYRIGLVAKRLNELGYYDLEGKPIQNSYGQALQEAVRNFQHDHGLQTDALIGNSTVTNLNMNRSDRYHQLLVNLERWRWYPRDLGDHYIIINVPDYRLSLIKGKDTLRSHKTMVGTEARKTPVFSDEIAYIVYNPTWTIPPTIKKNDVIPGASKDLSYLSKRNLKIYDSKGNTVDPASVNWSSPAARNYTYRQQAGPSNPLGTVKIIYPNEYMIYLHDTPSKELFKKNARAQSSGCVRVQDALDLAKYLLSDQEKYDEKRINDIIVSGRTTEIPVKQKVRVHHFYWTAFMQNDTTKFIDDIYKLDQKLWNQLKPAN
ncbi:L,D-transpeptidase family protein [Christiangramia salexigens]|uniref:L,D-TPase catalytic domain-containing protein n=1 Tax=Christiangramia salexigens TaxID=1913577 RepID=A0A1L3J4Z4_9FLAO|nr:L,D-transpeptidase family protein [Christiangramia salexigens]APG60196.1 hypothetical protein LPB144_07145 [Christiangramia salexigens]